MRHRKFRAWDPATGKMYDDSRLRYEYGEFEAVVETEEEKIKKLKHHCGSCDPEYDTIAEDVIVMDFTGILDKNGKEVYEGDIVKVSYSTMCYATIEEAKERQEKAGFGFPTETAIVKWIDKDLISGTYGGFGIVKPGSNEILCSIDWVREYGEVIGDIFNNPEILE